MRREPAFYPWAALVVLLGVVVAVVDNLGVGLVFIGVGVAASAFVYWWEHS